MDKRVALGRIGAPHGIKGWLRVFSDTWPPEEILSYERWFLECRNEWKTFEVVQARPQGKALIVQLQDEQGRLIEDRDQAAMLRNSTIAVWRSELPELEDDEIYWADLIGLNVETIEGVALGKVHTMMETGANDVLVVRGDRERLIPFVRDIVVKEIDLSRSLVRVDWDPEF
ncbi:MAG: ribosome maturation factor RimM [Salinisphaeraceae bacterium]|nr:ribosome maturation factor RimM [Salinisphaeraceae bacterium]